MLDHREAIGEAFDLAARSANLDLQTPELFVGNDYYGMATVLKQYAGMSLETRLKALLPHGVYLNDHLVAKAERRCGLPAVFAYPWYREPLYRRGTSMAVVPAAAPFVYALEMARSSMGRGPAEHMRSGTLLFPVHSTRFITVQADYDRMAEHAARLAQSGPVTVCLYFRDVQFGRHEAFEERGLPVVCAGHINDPAFLFRLAHLLLAHERAVGTSLGSHAFFAEVAECPYEYLQIDHDYVGNDRQVARDAPALTPQRLEEVAHLEDLFSSRDVARSDEKRAVAERYLGVQHRLEAGELRSLLAWCERLDRFGRAFVADADYGGSVIPAAAKRPLLRLGDAISAGLRRVRAFALGFVPRGVKDAAKRGMGGRSE